MVLNVLHLFSFKVNEDQVEKLGDRIKSSFFAAD